MRYLKIYVAGWTRFLPQQRKGGIEMESSIIIAIFVSFWATLLLTFAALKLRHWWINPEARMAGEWMVMVWDLLQKKPHLYDQANEHLLDFDPDNKEQADAERDVYDFCEVLRMRQPIMAAAVHRSRKPDSMAVETLLDALFAGHVRPDSLARYVKLGNCLKSAQLRCEFRLKDRFKIATHLYAHGVHFSIHPGIRSVSDLENQIASCNLEFTHLCIKPGESGFNIRSDNNIRRWALPQLMECYLSSLTDDKFLSAMPLSGFSSHFTNFKVVIDGCHRLHPAEKYASIDPLRIVGLYAQARCAYLADTIRKWSSDSVTVEMVKELAEEYWAVEKFCEMQIPSEQFGISRGALEALSAGEYNRLIDLAAEPRDIRPVVNP